MAQLVRVLAGWARWLVPSLGSPVQSQAGSWLSWLECWLAGLGGWCHAWGPRFNPRPGCYTILGLADFNVDTSSIQYLVVETH